VCSPETMATTYYECLLCVALAGKEAAFNDDLAWRAGRCSGPRVALCARATCARLPGGGLVEGRTAGDAAPRRCRAAHHPWPASARVCRSGAREERSLSVAEF
jgi:hypothetical protein